MSFCVGCEQDAPSQALPPYIAGSYQGTAIGCGGDLTLSTEFTEWAITKITILDHKESYRETFTLPAVKTAFEQIPAAIIAKQPPKVDGVSGATYTSNAITGAVEVCVQKARR
jgi:uncharacterized protein with FMN-binding domain